MVVGHPESYFTLMNQDIPLLEFSCQRNSFDEPAFFELQWRSPLRPIGYRGLPSFLEKRRAPQQRKNIQKLMAQYGCEDMEGFIRISHALSLNDTFWIREANSLLRWKDVSPYTNRFSESISHTAFDGSLGETDLSTISPEFCTGGRYAKCWLRQGDRVYLYKRGSTRHKVEPLSEYLAAQLASALCPDAVHYDLDYHRGELICKCPLFTSETVGYTNAGDIFPKYERTVPAVLQFFSEIGSDDAFRRMCILDAVILNTDRHYGNFGVLFDTSTMEILRMAPVFDHNRSLLPELDIDQLTTPEQFLPLYRPVLGNDFILTAKGLLTDSIRRDLEQLRSFTFHPHPTIYIEQKRLDALGKIVRNQIQRILM